MGEESNHWCDGVIFIFSEMGRVHFPHQCLLLHMLLYLVTVSIYLLIYLLLLPVDVSCSY